MTPCPQRDGVDQMDAEGLLGVPPHLAPDRTQRTIEQILRLFRPQEMLKTLLRGGLGQGTRLNGIRFNLFAFIEIIDLQ